MASGLRAQWDALVSGAWPVWGAALLVATVNVFLFAFDRPWTASDGLRNWGDWVLTAAGVVRRPDLLPPWLYSGSLLNLGVLLGGAAGALCAREFAIRVPARGELVKGAAGGALMGVGATLAFGCNIGGFFSAVSALSLAGFAMMLGLGVGAFLGLRYLLWETARRPHWSSGRGRGRAPRRHAVRHRHDPGRRLRRGLDLARRRGTGEALGRRRVLRRGRLRGATGARRRAGQARHRGVPAGGRRLGRGAAARDRGGDRVGARGDVERGRQKIHHTGLNRCTLPSQSSDRGSSRGTSWHG